MQSVFTYRRFLEVRDYFTNLLLTFSSKLNEFAKIFYYDSSGVYTSQTVIAN